MLSVAEAQKRIQEHVRSLPSRGFPLVPEDAILGLILAEDVRSDLDMPPFDKALMDGYALRSADLRAGRAELAVVEEVTAGQVPQRSVGPGEATRLMTGAPLPKGADAVVMVERCELSGQDRVRINDAGLRPGQNILTKGREMRTGEIVLRSGTMLRPQEIGLLASVGQSVVQMHPRPLVAVLATGDELVSPSERPGPGQIRNSNAAMLCAQVARAGGVPVGRGIVKDDVLALRAEIMDSLLHANVLLLSGGVSAGKRDLVPGVLADLGVRAIFHQVAMKPGKPVLFGIREGDGNGPTPLVFGLPGNPVSSLVCFELFVRPALCGLMGREPGPRFVHANLVKDYPYRSDRPTYHPAQIRPTSTGWDVEPVAWVGSSDLRSIVSANAFMLLPAGEHLHRSGQTFPVLCVEDV
jgi:molybdopterin molybdotransferase